MKTVRKWARRLLLYPLASALGCAVTAAMLILLALLPIMLIIAALKGGGPEDDAFRNLANQQVPSQPSQLALSQDPGGKLSLVMSISSKSECGIPWSVLYAIGEIEDSSFGAKKAIGPALNNYNKAGELVSITHAYGPAQFLIPTYASIDSSDPPQVFVRNAQGVMEEQPPPATAHIWQTSYAYQAMNNYLCKSGAGKDLSGALYAYNHSQAYVNDVLASAAKYTLAPPLEFGPVQCNQSPSNWSDFGQSLIADFRVYMPGFDPVHQQWAWEELCRLEVTKFDIYVSGARIEPTSLADTQQVGCPPSTSVKLGAFPDKTTFQFGLVHELGHVVFNCYIRNGKNPGLEVEFAIADRAEGGISYYARNAHSCTGSDNYSEDSADTVAYYLMPNLARTLLRCENGQPLPDLSKFPLHMSWAQRVLGR